MQNIFGNIRVINAVLLSNSLFISNLLKIYIVQKICIFYLKKCILYKKNLFKRKTFLYYKKSFKNKSLFLENYTVLFNEKLQIFTVNELN